MSDFLPALLKLNLGCGDDIRDGYLNVDFRQTHERVYQADLSKFPWPFRDRDAEEILMLDFLEHFPYSMTSAILLECHRVLAENGTVVIQVPDARHLTRALTQEGDYLCHRCGGRMFHSDEGNLGKCPDCGMPVDMISDAAIKRLYGGQDYPGNFHQTCFTERSLIRAAFLSGLQFVRFEEVEHQWKNWNVKARFKKGELW